MSSGFVELVHLLVRICNEKYYLKRNEIVLSVTRYTSMSAMFECYLFVQSVEETLLFLVMGQLALY